MVRRSIFFFITILLPASLFAQSVPIITEVRPEPVITEVTEEPSAAPGETGVVEIQATAPAPAEDFHGLLARGHALYASGDYPGALNAYESARAMQRGELTVYLFIGYAQAKLGIYDDAVATLLTLVNLTAGKQPSLHAKSLFVIAWVEEMRAEAEGIQTAWTAYEGYAQVHGDAVTYVTTSNARLAALNRMVQLDARYRLVRERIAGGAK